MSKFEELKKLAEKHLDYDYDVETLKQYCELEPQEIEYINMTNPATILALLADREQLRQALEDCKPNGWRNYVGEEACKVVLGMIDMTVREALKKSDEVDV